jgi:hypothetical protein
MIAVGTCNIHEGRDYFFFVLIDWDIIINDDIFPGVILTNFHIVNAMVVIFLALKHFL